MRNVYIIEYNNCEEYEDNSSWVGGFYFLSYREASDYLLEAGFEAYPRLCFKFDGYEQSVGFLLHDEEGFHEYIDARILEIEEFKFV